MRTRSDIYFVGNGYTTEMNSVYRFSALVFRNALINLFLFIFGKRSRRNKFGGGAFCIRSVRTRGIAAVRTATFRCITFRNRALTLYQIRLADSAYDYLCHFDQVSNANARRNLALLIDFSTSALRACGRNDKQGGGRRRMCAARRVLLYTVIYTVIRPAMRACGLSDPQNKPNRNRCSEL